jgi:hypothetical protein
MTGTTTRRSQCGPKTPKGRQAVRLNASTHGILSAQPVVGAYERAADWGATGRPLWTPSPGRAE